MNQPYTNPVSIKSNKNFYLLLWVESICNILSFLRVRLILYYTHPRMYNSYFSKRIIKDTQLNKTLLNIKAFKSNSRLVFIYKTFLNINSFHKHQNLTVNYNWVLFSIYNSYSNSGFINIRGLFLVFKNFYYLIYNLAFFNIKILYFGNNFFKIEILALNYALSNLFLKYLRYSYNFFLLFDLPRYLIMVG